MVIWFVGLSPSGCFIWEANALEYIHRGRRRERSAMALVDQIGVLLTLGRTGLVLLAYRVKSPAG